MGLTTLHDSRRYAISYLLVILSYLISYLSRERPSVALLEDFSANDAMAEPPMWSGPSVVTEPLPNAGTLPSPPAAPPYDPLYSDAASLVMPTSMPTLPNLVPSLPSLPSLPDLPALPALPALPGLPAPEEEEEVPAPMARPGGGGGMAGGEYQQVVGSRNTIVINTGTAENLTLTLSLALSLTLTLTLSLTLA